MFSGARFSQIKMAEVAFKFSAPVQLCRSVGFKTSRRDNEQMVRINIFFQGGIHLRGSQSLNVLIHFRFESRRAIQASQTRQHSGQRLVVGTANFACLQITIAGFVQFLLGHAIAKQAFEFFARSDLDAGTF